MTIARTWSKASDAFRSEFVRQIFGTFGTRLALVAAGLVTSVLIARSLGPEGRGALAIAAAVTAIAIQLGNLGLHASNTWAVSKEPGLLPALIANSLFLSLTVGGATIAATLVLGVLVPGLLPIEGALLAVALFAIPFGLASLLTQNLLLGVQRIRDYNLLEIGGRGLAIVTTVGLIFAGLASPLSFLIAGTAGATIVGLITIWRLWSIAGDRPRAQLSLVRRYAAFGLKAYSTALVSFLVLRFDLFLVEAFLGFEAVGEYSIAVAIADLVYSLPVVVGTLLFPRLARLESAQEQVHYARQIAQRIGILMAIGAFGAAVFADAAIRLLYGDAFAAAVPALIWLLPGIAILSVHTILMNYFAAIGLPRVALLAPLIGLVANVALNIWLIPQVGLVGASIASTLAYAAMFSISLLAFARRYRTLAPSAEVDRHDH